MEQTKLHIRLDFAPLDIATSIYVLSSGSPATQTYNANTGEYEPDRGLTPTVIVPQVILNAQDGSITDALGNADLAQMVWYVDEEDISTLSEWQGLYEIEADGDYKGAITIYKNLTSFEQHVLHFEAVVADTRTGVNYPIITEGITLSTVDNTDQIRYTLAMEHDTSIAYKPLADKLFAYEYGVANGDITDTTTGRANATDDCSYPKELPLVLYGNNGAVEGYTIRVFEILGWQDNAFELEEITINDDDDNEFDEISADKLVIDLRMIDHKEYLIKAYIDDEEVAFLQFGVARIQTPYNVMSINGAYRRITDTTRIDRVEVTANGVAITYPASIIKLLWKTDSYYLKGVEHGEGISVEYSIASTGAGDTTADGWIDEYVDSSYKEYHKVAVSEDDEVFCDENGETYIFN